MITLSLADIEAAIQAAFNHWLIQDPNSFHIDLSGNYVQVTVNVGAARFDCGIPGYNMLNGDVPALAAWVPLNITHGGSVGALAPCKMVGLTGQVNAYMLAAKTFNFHVNLVDAC